MKKIDPTMFVIDVGVCKLDDTDFTKEEREKLTDEFIRFIEEKGLYCGGAIG